jgi:hypothetical protein
MSGAYLGLGANFFLFLYLIIFRQLRGLLMCGALSVERSGLQFSIVAGPRQREREREGKVWGGIERHYMRRGGQENNVFGFEVL